MLQNPNTAIAVVGIDIGKNSFHIVGLDCPRRSLTEPGRANITRRPGTYLASCIVGECSRLVDLATVISRAERVARERGSSKAHQPSRRVFIHLVARVRNNCKQTGRDHRENQSRVFDPRRPSECRAPQ